MSERISELFESNRRWADAMLERDPDFFSSLARQQAPRYLWIGCSDSRVPATQITDLAPGEMFVHRNVANVVSPTDLNLLSVVQFAIEVLGVRDVLLCGHYGCGGVEAVLDGSRHGLVDHWLRAVEEVAERHAAELARLPDRASRSRRLCELNVRAQVDNLCRSSVLHDAWEAGRDVEVNGIIYDVGEGRLQDLGVRRSAPERDGGPGTTDREPEGGR